MGSRLGATLGTPMLVPGWVSARKAAVMLAIGIAIACGSLAVRMLVLVDTFSAVADPTRRGDAKQRALDDALLLGQATRVTLVAGIVLSAVGGALWIALRRR